MANGNPKNKKSPQNQNPNRRTMIVGGSVVGGLIVVVAIVVLIVARAGGGGGATFDYAKLPRLGNVHAPVKVVEFGDFKCSACKYFHDNIFPQLQQTYIDTGTVQFYFMNFPFIGPDSTTAAEAGLAIFHQRPGAFWDYYNAMYNNQGSEQVDWATPNFILRLATHDVPGINYTLLGQEIAQQKYKSVVEAQYARGQQLGVNSTPTLFINGHEFLDFSNWPALQAAIQKYK